MRLIGSTTVAQLADDRWDIVIEPCADQRAQLTQGDQVLGGEGASV